MQPEDRRRSPYQPTTGRVPPGPRRREVLAAAGVTLAGLAAAGCDVFSTSPSTGSGSGSGSGGSGGSRGGGGGGGGGGPKESPALTSQVRAGKLPELAERVSADPQVVKPFERPGRYGGTLRNALGGSADAVYVYLFTGYDQLLRFTPEWTGATGTSELEPDVAARYDVSDDGTQFTFHLRRDMKWSDGEPFTADDVVFAVDDILLNKEITPVPPEWFVTTNGKPGRIEKVDDQTFRFIFTEPAGLLLHNLAGPSAPVLTASPKHYLSKFHKKYTPDADHLAKKAGFRDWVELIGARSYGSGAVNPHLPTIAAWQLETPLGQGTQVVLKRNPYYWKTDPSGAQLPYIDTVLFDVVNDVEVMLLKALHGDMNIEAGPNSRITTSRNKPIFARNRTRGKLRFVDATDAHMNLICIYLNQTSKDPQKKRLFGNRDFRIGLSYAINRKEIIDSTMQRQGSPYQAAPLPESAFYDADFAHQYLEFDVDRANSYLDRVAPKKNAQGQRLQPDGKPIMFTVEFATAMHPEWPDALELVKGYWHDVGIDVNVKSASQELVREHAAASEFDCTVWHGDGGLACLLAPVNYFPMTPYNGWFAPAWGAWYSTGGETGERPPDKARQQMRLYDKLKSAATAGDQEKLLKQLLAIAREEFYVIGVVRTKDTYFVAADTLHNLPDPMISAWYYPSPGPSRPEQYFFA